MKNKIILSILILSMITLIFSGCGGGNLVTPPTSTPVVELVKPLDDYENNISQRFGNYLGYYGGKYYNGFHSGEDIAVVAGTPVYAITSGRVAKISDLGALGHLVVLEHNKGPFKIPGRNEEIHGQSYHYPLEEVDTIYSVYVHVDPNNLSENDWVETGEKIADIADISAAGLGAHLHFGIRNPDQEPSSNWIMVGNSSNWSQFADGSYNGYYKNLQEMVDAGLRHPSDFLGLASPLNIYTITASAGSNGSISPSGNVTVNQGLDKSFTITPDTGYSIDDVLVDGSSVGAVSSYTFTNVTEDHTIYATFISEASGSIHNLTKGTYYDTIQSALDDADNDNTIEVADGTYDESITFSPGKKIIVQSVNGASSTVIRGNNYIDTVHLSNSPEGTMLKGFTITHAEGLIGRGIYITGGNLSIKNCNIIDNDFTNYCRGSGIDNEGTLTITESIISGNTTYGSGGGIDNYNGTITITASTISSNSAGSGGGIENGNGILTIDESIISGNFSNSAGSGGGIDNYNGTITIIASTISGNSADIGGGGISNGNGTLTITASTISSNSAGSGGGIANVGILNINTSAIHNNFASLLGGGVYNGSSLNITGSEIFDNFAYYHGGGICNYNEGTLIITESTISGNTTDDADAGGGGSADIGGGGISNCGILTIVTSTISDNTTDDTGGGIETFNDGTLTITGSTISANSADYASGGIHLHNSWGSITIGGEIPNDKNTICGNYKSDYSPSLDQQIRGDSGSLYDTYKNNNYISVYCD